MAELLARSGVGCIRLVDNDVFDESNLNRQRFCTERVIGQPKVRVVRDALADIASHVEAEALEMRADSSNLSCLVAGMDVALDCLDNIGAKTALERAALLRAYPLYTVLCCAKKVLPTPAQARRPGLRSCIRMGRAKASLSTPARARARAPCITSTSPCRRWRG